MGFFDKFTNLFWGKKIHDNLTKDEMTNEEESEMVMFFDYLLQEELNEIEDEEDEE